VICDQRGEARTALITNHQSQITNHLCVPGDLGVPGRVNYGRWMAGEPEAEGSGGTGVGRLKTGDVGVRGVGELEGGGGAAGVGESKAGGDTASGVGEP
jgi:hypothetical protein